MDNRHTTVLIGAMDALLEEERAALLDGDLDGLNDLHTRKSELLDQIQDADAQHAEADLRGIQHKLTRNQALLDSALEGIRGVARRLATVRRVRQTLEYYDEAGAKASVEIDVRHEVEKRA